MKVQRPYPRATITSKGEHALAKGHPWVYEAEVLFMEGAPGQGDEVANGSLIDVVNRKGSYLGTGLLSKSSKIRIRLITRNANDAFDRAFWKRKVAWAWEYRKTVMGEDASCCRAAGILQPAAAATSWTPSVSGMWLPAPRMMRACSCGRLRSASRRPTTPSSGVFPKPTT